MADFAPYVPESPNNDRTFAAYEGVKRTVIQVDNDSLYSRSVVRQIKKNRELEERENFHKDSVYGRQLAYRKRKLAGMFNDYAKQDYPQPSAVPVTVGDSTDKPVSNNNRPAPLKPTFKGIAGNSVMGRPALQTINQDSVDAIFFDDLE